MPDVPYPITANNAEELRRQVWELVRELFEERIAGLNIGDVFYDGGGVLTLNIDATNPGLKKIANALQIKVKPLGGFELTSTGLGVDLKSGGGIDVDSGGLFVTSSGVGAFVPKSLYDANTILYATTDDTPVALTVAASTVVGRKATGNISAMSATESRVVLGLAVGDSPVFATVKLSALTDGYIIYHVDDATGLANGPAKTDVDSAVSLKHNAVTLAASADTLLGLSTQELSLDAQTANYVFAGPVTGAATVPSFRALVSADINEIDGGTW